MFKKQTRRSSSPHSRGINAISAWYGRHPRAFTVGAIVLLLIIAVQVLYPTDRALPLSRLGGEGVGFSSQQDIAASLQKGYGSTIVTTEVRGIKASVPLEKTGIVTDNDKILAGLDSYPWYLRIIPLSLFVKGALTDQPVVTTTDAVKFSVYAADRSKECHVAPKNAGVIVLNADVALDPAKDGQKCTEASLKRQMTERPLTKNGLHISLDTTPVKPERSDKDVQPLLKEAKAVAERDLTLSVAGKTYQVDKPTIASWLAFPEDEAGHITVGLNPETVKAYLATIQKDIYIAPGVTVITTKDSIETSRTTGSNGQGIDQDATYEAIKKQLLSESGTVTAQLAVLPPTLRYERSYSKTPEGLQALLNDIAKSHSDMAISVRKLGDSGVSVNGDKQYHPASTYKLFVAYSVLKRVDDGRYNLGQTTSGGQTLAQCLEKMIVVSDNTCAEWFGVSMGWSAVTAEARALGAAHTTLNRPFVSTTNDQALLLQKLESNQLGLSEASRSRLLDLMKRQVYRKGIPAGVGVTVADKVGFLDGLLHDSAIVYAPSGVYVLVIYSDNGTWADIADAAKQIHAQLQ